MSDIERAEQSQIGTTILMQLGGNQFKAMVKTKHMYALERNVEEGQRGGLRFRFTGCKKANFCKIVYNTDDLYDIEFGKIKRSDAAVPYEVVETFESYYDDMLRPMFEEFTGLLTSLGTLGR